MKRLDLPESTNKKCQSEISEEYEETDLRATKTLRALSAACPNTFLKNNDATVTPLCKISSFDAALRTEMKLSVTRLNSKCDLHSREICYIGEDVQKSTNAQTKGCSDLQSPNGVFDIIHNIVHI